MKTETVPQVNEICRISKATSISGVLKSSSDIRVDGHFEGQIVTKGRVVVGESANIEGKIFCQNADIWGKVKGEIYVEDVFTLKSSSNFAGELKSTKVSIELGAIFNGACNIITVDEYKKILKEHCPEEEKPKEVSASKDVKK